MAIVEMMYGVGFEGVNSLGGLSEPCINGYPSVGFINELESLSNGTKVGIEIETNRSLGKLYWDKIFGICKEKGFEVVCLGDSKLWTVIEKKKQEARRMQSSLDEIKVQAKPHCFDPLIEMQFSAYINKALTDAEYIRCIDLGEKIIDNIVKHKPEVAILNSVYGDYIFQCSEEMARRGLEVRGYRVDEVEVGKIDWSLMSKYMGPIRPTFKEHNTSQGLVIRESVIRQYGALLKGE